MSGRRPPTNNLQIGHAEPTISRALMTMMSRRCCTQRLPKRPYFCATAALAVASSSCVSLLPLALAFGPVPVAHHQRRHIQVNTHVALNLHVSRSSSATTFTRHVAPLASLDMSHRFACCLYLPASFSNYVTKRYAHAQAGDTEASDSFIDDTDDLSTELRQAYEARDTDGIMDVFSSGTMLQSIPAESLIQASIDASDGRPGMAASILNGLLGSCVLMSNNESTVGAQKALELIDVWEDIAKDENVHPDLVSYCLAYSAVHPIVETDEYFADAAEDMLERARRLAKKTGGTKYRKANAKARRKGGSAAYAKDAIDTLQERYGADFNILHEDDDVVVISKPSGMVCYHMRKTTAGKVGRKKRKKGAKENTVIDADISLVDALVEDAKIRLSTLNPNAGGICHRIDRGTSGCIALAKNDIMHALLVSEFFTRGAKKTYEALVPSRPVEIHGQDNVLDPLPEFGEINLPINNKSARSAYKISQQFGDEAIRIEMETFTGRKHQVRRHAAEGLSRPLFLDIMYWDSRNLREEDLPVPIANLSEGSTRKDENERFFLHASSLRIPKLGIDVEAPLPLWWQEVEKKLS